MLGKKRFDQPRSPTYHGRTYEGLLMFNRVISLILIAAVFGCPLWCSMGLCSCSSEITALNGAASECCCGNAVDADTSGLPRKGTSEPEPEGLRCQGICGGAVLESPFRVPVADFCQFFNCLESKAYLSYAREHCFDRKAATLQIPRAKNEGRSVRIRFMSFQC